MDKTKETETRSSQGQKYNGHCLDILENDRDLGELGVEGQPVNTWLSTPQRRGST